MQEGRREASLGPLGLLTRGLGCLEQESERAEGTEAGAPQAALGRSLPWQRSWRCASRPTRLCSPAPRLPRLCLQSQGQCRASLQRDPRRRVVAL